MSKNNVEYCYKVKHSYIKVKENNAYAKPKIEKFGFKPMQEIYKNEAGEETYCWAEGWAKTIKLSPKSPVAKWVRENIESIYKKEKENADSTWLKELLDAGYEFDEEGNLIQNEKYLSGLEAQLCVMFSGEYRGILFINAGGTVEFYDSNVLVGSAFGDIMRLVKAGVIYKKRFNV